MNDVGRERPSTFRMDGGFDGGPYGEKIYSVFFNNINTVGLVTIIFIIENEW